MKLKKKAAKAVYSITVDQRELDTIIAALRGWQGVLVAGLAGFGNVPALKDIACEHGKPLTAKEIDALVENINFA